MEIPENIDVVTASAIPEVWLTSYQLLNYSGIKENEIALIHAASSGIGTALIQLIKKRKAFAIGLCSTEDKIKFIEK
jgi:NADPH:quinone reductase-like Zn-dependent oxidoreductase